MARPRAESVKPVKTSDRTVAQIVVEKELELYSHIIDGTRKDCGENCRCQGCFQRALDRLVKVGEEALNDDRQAGVVGNACIDELQAYAESNAAGMQGPVSL